VCLAAGLTTGCDKTTVGEADAAAPSSDAPSGATPGDATATFGGDDSSSGTGDGGSYVDPLVFDAAVTSWDGRAPLTHRDAGTDCPRDRAEDAGSPPFSSLPFPGNTCAHNADCTAGQNGRCLSEPNYGAPDPVTGQEIAYNETYCSYDDCFVDSDCGLRVPCDCRIQNIYGAPNVCLLGSNCALDSDCQPPGFCSRSYGLPKEPDYGFFCHTTNDTCIDDVDCPPRVGDTEYTCRFDSTLARWRCFAEPVRP
jgi:hypothetical protein